MQQAGRLGVLLLITLLTWLLASRVPLCFLDRPAVNPRLLILVQLWTKPLLRPQHWYLPLSAKRSGRSSAEGGPPIGCSRAFGTSGQAQDSQRIESGGGLGEQPRGSGLGRTGSPWKQHVPNPAPLSQP